MAYEELKPFPRRKDLNLKQTYHSKILTNSWSLKQFENQKFIQQDYLVSFFFDI